MKLIFCPECEEILKLSSAVMKRCTCRASYGDLKKDGKAMYGGEAVPLLINDQDLYNCLYNLRTGRVTKEELTFTIKFINKKNEQG